VRSMAYAVGQTVEVCLDYDLPPAQGVRRVVATFANARRTAEDRLRGEGHTEVVEWRLR
jgi:hypothetical protein